MKRRYATVRSSYKFNTNCQIFKIQINFRIKNLYYNVSNFFFHLPILLIKNKLITKSYSVCTVLLSYLIIEEEITSFLKKLIVRDLICYWCSKQFTGRT